MVPSFLVPECIAREDGSGAEVALGSVQGKPLHLTLGITRIIEQESLDLLIYGSADGQTWRQIAAFPQKFYCGTYSFVLDLTRHRDIKYVRANWKMGRWGSGDPKPLFGFYLFAEEARMQVAVGAA